ncbi:MAG: extracellular solute-binding protein [Bauldia sp.]
MLINLLPNYGASDFDANGNSLLATDASVRVHDILIKQIIKPLGPKSWIGTDWDTARRRFAQGESAMFFDADWFAGLYEDPSQSKIAGKVKYLNFGSADSKYVDYYYFGAAINDHSANKKAAWLVAQYITSKKVMRDSAVNSRLLMPTRFSTFDDPEFVKMTGSWGDGTWITAAKANLSKWSRAAILPNDQYGQVKTIWAGAAAKMYEGATAKDALTDAVSQINELMERGGYRKG